MDIKKIEKEYKEVLNQLSDPELISDWKKMEELSKKKKKLEAIIEKKNEIEEIEKRIIENKNIIKEESEPELVIIAEHELNDLIQQKQKLESQLDELLQDKPKSHISSVIMEIRAGTGGDEAALFVADLLRMYLKFADEQHWQYRILDSSPTDLKGYKEVIFEIKGSDAYSKMKYEAGVHRVQRIPETEKSGRIHTSTATVAVLAKPKKTEININPQDLKIDIAKSSGPGGQNVNKRMTAVRITHLPTGITVKSQAERSLPQNKENALAILEARLLEKKEKEEISKIDKERRAQIGTAERAEKIRTYNFPQDRVTDHRIKKSWQNIEDIMNGNLNKIIEALQEKMKN